jgi:hypothetical protein
MNIIDALAIKNGENMSDFTYAFFAGIALLCMTLLGGCGARTYSTSYQEAVSKLTHAYPIPDEGKDYEYYQQLGKKYPAYAEELQDTSLFQMPWGLTVGHGEIKEGQEYHIGIYKSWKFASPRQTIIRIKRASENTVTVSVQSERQLGPYCWARDATHESQRFAEIDRILSPSAPSH